MKIEKILNQNRRDFTAVYKCEHCSKTKQDRGYDDAYFHGTVIPAMACESCGLTADSETFRPLGTKYAEGEVV